MADRQGTVSGKAMLVPFQTLDDELFNTSNLTSRDRVKISLPLVLVETDAGPVTGGKRQRVDARVPNWLRVVFCYSGSTYGPWEKLPRNTFVAVSVVPETGQIVDVGIAAAEAEYEQYREVAVKYWKLTEAPLAPVRTVASLPGRAPKFLKSLVRELKDVAGEIRHLGDTGPSDPHAYDEKELEQIRRNADQVGLSLRNKPKELEKFRQSALSAGDIVADRVKADPRHAQELEVFLDMNLRYGAITEEEAGAWRARGGLGD
ncbi:MAG: hypothetical protein ACSLFD_04085 [Solirubrobacterales bacterium]